MSHECPMNTRRNDSYGARQAFDLSFSSWYQDGKYVTHDATMRSQVGPGGCPPRPPSDPDVRDYRIRLLGTADSLHTRCAPDLLSDGLTLRCRTGSKSPTSIRPSVPIPRRPLPSTGSLWDRFPGFLGTMSRSDSPPSVPVGSFPRPAVPSRALCFAPAIGEHSP